MCENWSRLRSILNHDWLKNEYLKNLDGLILRMQTSSLFDANIASEMQAYLSTWERKHSEIEKLLNLAEDNLSPSTLFYKEPLNRCSAGHRSWLEPLIHGLWLFRYGVREKVIEARGLLSDADRTVGKLKVDLLKNDLDNNIGIALENFADTVKQLSQVISGLPTKVLTI